MAYRIEYGPRDMRTKIGPFRTDEVMRMYDEVKLKGEADIKIFDQEGELRDPHQLSLDLRSAWGR